MTPKLVAVVAKARNGAIGVGGAMPWKVSSDLKRFKALTMGKPVIMGRKTWDAIGRPLPGRETIVVTRDSRFAPPQAHVAHNLDEALAQAQQSAAQLGATEIIVGGGAQIYSGLLDQTETIHLTEIDLDIPGDAFFPSLDSAQWRETARETPLRGPRDEAAFSFVTLERRR